MYPSRGGNAYGQQQPYASQSAYSQNLGPAYSASSVGGPDGGSQLSMASRHSSMLGGPQESDITGYRGHPSAGAHYGGPYSSVYGSAALSSSQQVAGMNANGAGSFVLEGRSGYGSTMPDSTKHTTGDYTLPSSHGYGQKSNQLFSEKISDHPSVDRHQYGERQSAYVGRDLPNVSTGRFGDSVSFDNQHKPDMYELMDQALLLRQEQMLKAQSLQSASLDGGSRQADYLAARGASIRRSAQDLMSYGGRIDTDPHSLSMLSGSSYGGQHASSILGAAPRRNVDDLMYAQSSSNPGYGVSLPPGRDYATGKGLQDASLNLDYPGNLSRGVHSRIDDHKGDSVGYARELERKEERRRDHLREREKDREREKEERERERARERKRERERERELLLERWGKERDRELERGLETKRERGPETKRELTPPRISRERAERRGSSLTKDVRPPRKDSPHHETLHRRHSPVKEKRREYDCKVYSSSLVEVERDYLSLDKRYPRLFISPECSKVFVNWPREDLRLSIHTPISFEHDFVEDDAGARQKEPPAISSADEPVKSKSPTTVWNAKMILMSGLSQNSLEELSSEKRYDGRIPHFCNMLRFAVLRKDYTFMAIGGPWDTVDGGDPSVDNSSLVRTVLRYANDVTQLDLKNCRHWNRFLEIHYDRLGKDGLFSHKEITVLFVPDLSDCLPSMEAWRDQWLAHKKDIAERRRLLALKKEKSREKEPLIDNEVGSSKEGKGGNKPEKKEESISPRLAVTANNKQKDDHELNGNTTNKEVGDNDKPEKKGGVTIDDEGKNAGKKELGESGGVQTAGSGKSGKKKIIKKIVKQKVADKKEGLDDPTKQNDKLEEKNVGENIANSEITLQQDVSPANTAGVKTFVRKKIVKKVPVAKAVQTENEGKQPELKTDKGPENSEGKPKGVSDSSSAALVQDVTVKATAKKKVIKRVLKRKVTGVEASEGVTDSKKEGKILGDRTVDTGIHVGEANAGKEVTPEMSKSVTPEKQVDLGNSSKILSKVVDKEDKNAAKRVDGKSGSASKIDSEVDKQKVSSNDNHSGKREKSKERDKLKVEEKKVKKGKDDAKNKSGKEAKEKKQPEEPPRHPGLFLQTKGSKDSKLCSLSLSLDSLLDYTDKDFEDSTFELSLFAESLYEMLQYQMGCHLLKFLQKLRIKFVTKRNLRKRQREESAKGSDKKTSTKRAKADEVLEAKSTKTETKDAAHHDDGKNNVNEEDTSVQGVGNVKPVNKNVEEDTPVSRVENVKPEDEMDDEDQEEDPEEDPEEDEDMLDTNPQHDLSNEENAVVGKTDTDTNSEKVAESPKDKENVNDKEQETASPKDKANAKDKEGGETADQPSERKPMAGSESKENTETTESNKKEKLPVVVDKELLQAFRFFDRNRVGYVRVEDMRLILHNLGKFLSYRDVKELAQSALLESNTGRDDRILYDKLVRMTDI